MGEPRTGWPAFVKSTRSPGVNPDPTKFTVSPEPKQGFAGRVWSVAAAAAEEAARLATVAPAAARESFIRILRFTSEGPREASGTSRIAPAGGKGRFRPSHLDRKDAPCRRT
jgi:hypothetical protein